MAIVQTAYTNFIDNLVPGQVFDIQTCDVDTGVLKGDDVPFGFAVQPYTGANPGDQDVELGASRAPAGALGAALAMAGTALAFAAAPARGRLQIGDELVIASEIVRVTAITSDTAYTITRGERGSAAADHANGLAVSYFHTALFRGVAIQDERVPAKNGTVFKESDAIPVLYRGNVVVPVDVAVEKDDHVVVTTETDADDLEGSFSNRAPDATHVLIPRARFIRSAAAAGNAVVRFGE